MRLSEYQTKQIFARYGIPVPRGRVASSSREVSQIAEELGGQVVIKAQVLVHARGRLGGIRVARSVYEAIRNEPAVDPAALDLAYWERKRGPGCIQELEQLLERKLRK